MHMVVANWISQFRTGQTKSLGVFFWATDSEINHDPRFPNRFTAENHINASAMDGFVHSIDR